MVWEQQHQSPLENSPNHTSREIGNEETVSAKNVFSKTAKEIESNQVSGQVQQAAVEELKGNELPQVARLEPICCQSQPVLRACVQIHVVDALERIRND